MPLLPPPRPPLPHFSWHGMPAQDSPTAPCLRHCLCPPQASSCWTACVGSSCCEPPSSSCAPPAPLAHPPYWDDATPLPPHQWNVPFCRAGSAYYFSLSDICLASPSALQPLRKHGRSGVFKLPGQCPPSSESLPPTPPCGDPVALGQHHPHTLSLSPTTSLRLCRWQ
ncbi:hypothetical protein F751_5063 [Auxenochlorella protothecoides]|uniref:Uncharacterized protein n=1 Tax=Auxenochlorella protothecoides TaxID=3075 RepID=A0A087SER7_AUXPR|nr:hypothetical protein F751_5063 [Auxenochlorella protothecoides]KFM24221.1 hypothetical protein F751_5063 [Auxenochlorella protothecoides]